MKLLVLCYVLPVDFPSVPKPVEVIQQDTELLEPPNINNQGEQVKVVDSNISSLLETNSTPKSKWGDIRDVFVNAPLLPANNDLLTLTSSDSSGNSSTSCSLSIFTGSVDLSTPSCVPLLMVRPVSVLVRRLPARGESYKSVGEVQQKYQSCSILKVGSRLFRLQNMCVCNHSKISK